MSGIAKLVLVPSEIAEKFNSKPLNEMDEEMQNIFRSSDNDSIKWKKYSQVLQRYLHFKKEQNAPIELGIMPSLSSSTQFNQPEFNIVDTNATEEQNSHHEDEESDSEENVISSIICRTIKKAKLTPGQSGKAINLFKELLEKNVLSADLRGQMIADGKVFKGSHIVDLLSYLIKKKTNVKEPIAWNQFKLLLHSKKFPIANFGLSLLKSPQVRRITRQHPDRGEATSSSGRGRISLEQSPTSRYKVTPRKYSYNFKPSHKQWKPMMLI